MRLAEGRIPTMEGTLRVQRNSRGSAVEVRADADGIISHAGVGLLVERLATDPDGLARLRAARAHARARAWQAGAHPDSELLLVDLDATLVDAHSEKQGAAGTYTHTFGFHPLLAYLDRADGTGEPLAGVLRPGNAAANATADLVEVAELALAQLPALAGGQRVVMRS